MKTSAQPADVRASATFGTVKKRMITCGNPAVPIISDRVSRNMLSVLPFCAVYAANPRSVTTWSSLSSSRTPEPSDIVLPRPSCGTGLPVRFSEMKTAGTV